MWLARTRVLVFTHRTDRRGRFEKDGRPYRLDLQTGEMRRGSQVSGVGAAVRGDAHGHREPWGKMSFKDTLILKGIQAEMSCRQLGCRPRVQERGPGWRESRVPGVSMALTATQRMASPSEREGPVRQGWRSPSVRRTR